MIENSVFPDSLKQADIKPVYKADSKNKKENYRPVSILSNLSKTYERYMYTQMDKYFDSILSKYQFGFRKGYSAQQCLLMESVFRSEGNLRSAFNRSIESF